MKLGAFSISLNVKDLEKSRQFYEKLGFKVFAGDLSNNYLILKNGNAIVGLFQGMFDKNILTFNPGWDENAKLLNSFDDIRKIQQSLQNQGIKLEQQVNEDSSGPGSIALIDPDGNPILIDQHV